MKSKMVAIFVTLMVALMLAGFAYAHWSETLYLDATVNTGDLNVKFSSCSTNDCGDSNDPGLSNVVTTTDTADGYSDTYAASGTYTRYGKNVATTTCEIIDNYNGGEKANKLKITIENAYPSYAPEIIIVVDNVGDIPVKMTDLTITNAECDKVPNPQQTDPGKKLDEDFGMELIAWEVTLNGEHQYGSSKGHYDNLPFTVDEVDEGMLCFNDLVNYLKTVQVDGGEYLDIHLIFHFEQWLPEDATITFDMTATFTQWNLAG